MQAPARIPASPGGLEQEQQPGPVFLEDNEGSWAFGVMNHVVAPLTAFGRGKQGGASDGSTILNPGARPSNRKMRTGVRSGPPLFISNRSDSASLALGTMVVVNKGFNPKPFSHAHAVHAVNPSPTLTAVQAQHLLQGHGASSLKAPGRDFYLRPDRLGIVSAGTLSGCA